MKKLLIILGIFFVSALSKAQIRPEAFLENSKIDNCDSNTLYLKTDNVNFLKNNEFFNDYYDGYTLIGYWLRPSLVYKPSAKTKIQAGVHVLKYSGVTDFTQTLPFLRFQYHFNKYMDIVMGSLYGSDNHQLIEPIFSQENFYEKNIENGVQFLTSTKWLQSDLWLNWEKFIFPNSSVKEEFVIGTSNKIFLMDTANKFQIYVPLQMLVAHKGGQIDTSENDMESLKNTAVGLGFSMKFQNKFFQKIDFNAYLVNYKDISHNLHQPYKSGQSYYTTATLFTKYADLMLGYWNGNKFIGPRGEPLFQSISTKGEEYNKENHQLILAKFNLFTQKIKNVYLSGGFELYHDPVAGTSDYWYGCHIIYRDLFKIKKFK